MCGRYEFSRRTESDLILAVLNELASREIAVKTGTVAPGNTAAVLASDRNYKARAFGMHWGYRMADGKLLFNARSETASEKALFTDGMRQRRCLIPAERYYEWEKTSSGKQKYAIMPSGAKGFYMAGIYRIVQGRPEFSILTGTPADSIAFIHDRMPVILPEAAMSDWLNPRFHGISILRAAVSDMQYTPETKT